MYLKMAKWGNKAERECILLENMKWNADSFTDFSLFKTAFMHHPGHDKALPYRL